MSELTEQEVENLRYHLAIEDFITKAEHTNWVFKPSPYSVILAEDFLKETLVQHNGEIERLSKLIYPDKHPAPENFKSQLQYFVLWTLQKTNGSYLFHGDGYTMIGLRPNKIDYHLIMRVLRNEKEFKYFVIRLTTTTVSMEWEEVWITLDRLIERFGFKKRRKKRAVVSESAETLPWEEPGEREFTPGEKDAVIEEMLRQSL